MFKILQKFLPEIINLLLTFYLQAKVTRMRRAVIQAFLFLSNEKKNTQHSVCSLSVCEVQYYTLK